MMCTLSELRFAMSAQNEEFNFRAIFNIYYTQKEIC